MNLYLAKQLYLCNMLTSQSLILIIKQHLRIYTIMDKIASALSIPDHLNVYPWILVGKSNLEYQWVCFVEISFSFVKVKTRG